MTTVRTNNSVNTTSLEDLYALDGLAENDATAADEAASGGSGAGTKKTKEEKQAERKAAKEAKKAEKAAAKAAKEAEKSAEAVPSEPVELQEGLGATVSAGYSGQSVDLAVDGYNTVQGGLLEFDITQQAPIKGPLKYNAAGGIGVAGQWGKVPYTDEKDSSNETLCTDDGFDFGAAGGDGDQCSSPDAGATNYNQYKSSNMSNIYAAGRFQLGAQLPGALKAFSLFGGLEVRGAYYPDAHMPITGFDGSTLVHKEIEVQGGPVAELQWRPHQKGWETMQLGLRGGYLFGSTTLKTLNVEDVYLSDEGTAGASTPDMAFHPSKAPTWYATAGFTYYFGKTAKKDAPAPAPAAVEDAPVAAPEAAPDVAPKSVVDPEDLPGRLNELAKKHSFDSVEALLLRCHILGIIKTKAKNDEPSVFVVKHTDGTTTILSTTAAVIDLIEEALIDCGVEGKCADPAPETAPAADTTSSASVGAVEVSAGQVYKPASVTEGDVFTDVDGKDYMMVNGEKRPVVYETKTNISF